MMIDTNRHVPTPIVMVPAILTLITRGRALEQPAFDELPATEESPEPGEDESEQEPEIVQFLRRGEIPDDADTDADSSWRDAG
jgi:hypothetical protein